MSMPAIPFLSGGAGGGYGIQGSPSTGWNFYRPAGTPATEKIASFGVGATEVALIRADGMTEASGVVRSTGSAAPTSGVGAEMSYAGGTATYAGINRGAGTLTATVIDGNATYIRYNSAERIVADVNGVTLYAPQYFRQYTVATMPSPAIPGGGIFVSDAAGSPCLALSNGANFKRCDDMTVTVT